LVFETRAAAFLHFLAVVPLLVSPKEDGNELVAALPDLTSRLFEADVVTELRHRFVPGERVQILAMRTDALLPRMMRIIEDLEGDWRRGRWIEPSTCGA
jgi:hypothetical protein